MPGPIVDEDTTLPELIEALVHLNATAKRLPHIYGGGRYVTPWDKTHARLDDLLYEWEMKS